MPGFSCWRLEISILWFQWKFKIMTTVEKSCEFLKQRRKWLNKRIHELAESLVAEVHNNINLICIWYVFPISISKIGVVVVAENEGVPNQQFFFLDGGWGDGVELVCTRSARSDRLEGCQTANAGRQRRVAPDMRPPHQVGHELDSGRDVWAVDNV